MIPTTCCDPDSQTFWAGRLAVARNLVIAYDAALLALAGGAQSYQLDTGQTRQMVSKANLRDLEATRAALLNEVATLEARLGCGGSTHAVPNW